jgi:hypothetical protein
MPVGAPGRDGKRSRQHGAWQSHHNLVADDKVVGSTDNPAHSGSIRCVFGSHLHLAPANGLSIALGFIDEIEDFSNNYGAGDLEAVDVFFFETD